MVEVSITDSKRETDATPPAPPEKPHRTLGLKLFDVFLYPVFNNFAVFGMSVVATYLTSHGKNIGKDGSLLRKTGDFFQKRGDWLMGKFEKMGMSHGQADMSKMVFFSFADGTLFAPFIKIFEDRREKIAHKIDKALGTAPQNLAAYEAEPKQGWGSVIGGRLATAAIIVPTAVALDKTGLNDKLFRNPGLKVGEWIEKKPKLAKYFGKLNVPGLFKIGFFEMFYTSVCTAGLYFSSRAIARLGGKDNHLHAPAETAAPADTQTQAPTEPATATRSSTHRDRLAAQYEKMSDTPAHGMSL